ncbi:MAG: DUF6363 domain-containing protein [Eubacterium ramulus]
MIIVVLWLPCALPAACKPIEIDGKLYYDGGVTDAIPVQRALDDGCDKIVAILSKPRGFMKKPEGMRFLYSRMCRKFPNTVKALDNRHIMYGKCQQQLFDLEKEGKAFIFAPSNPPKMSTYTMDREVEQQLYDLGMKDFHDAEIDSNLFDRKLCMDEHMGEYVIVHFLAI